MNRIRSRAEDYRFACLTYHVLGSEAGQYGVSEQQFRDHLEQLQKNQYVVEGFEQLEDRLRTRRVWPPRYLVLTLDDGHESSMKAAEILEEHGCKATFFVTRDRTLGKPRSLSAHQIRDLRQRQFSLGTHGTTHRKLTLMPDGACVRELRESKQWLEDVLGEEVRYMAAPGGFINSRVKTRAMEEGYAMIGTCREWMNSAHGMRLPCDVNRVNVRRHFSAETVRRIAEGNLTLYLWRQLRTAVLSLPKQLLRD